MALACSLGSLAQSLAPQCSLVLESFCQDTDEPGSACDVLPLCRGPVGLCHGLRLRWQSGGALRENGGTCRLLCQGPRSPPDEARTFLQPYFSLVKHAGAVDTKVAFVAAPLPSAARGPSPLQHRRLPLSHAIPSPFSLSLSLFLSPPPPSPFPPPP